MLEIIFLISFSRKIGALAEQKGHRGTRYRVLTWLLWFGGEISGFIVGMLFIQSEGFGVYFTALIGAMAGAGMAYWIVNNLEDLNRPDFVKPDWVCPKCGHGNRRADWIRCAACGEVKSTCGKCGQVVSENHRFCPKCGAQL